MPRNLRRHGARHTFRRMMNARHNWSEVRRPDREARILMNNRWTSMPTSVHYTGWPDKCACATAPPSGRSMRKLRGHWRGESHQRNFGVWESGGWEILSSLPGRVSATVEKLAPTCTRPVHMQSAARDRTPASDVGAAWRLAYAACAAGCRPSHALCAAGGKVCQRCAHHDPVSSRVVATTRRIAQQRMTLHT